MSGIEEFNLEYVWLAFEAKIRNLVKNLIEPSIHRFQLNELNCEKILKKNKTHKIRFTELNKKFESLAAKLPNMESINRLVVDSNIKINSADIENKKFAENASTEINAMKNNVEDLTSQFSLMISQFEKLEKEVKHTTSNVYKVKSILDLNLSENYAEFEKKIQMVKQEIDQINEKANKSEKKMHFLEGGLCEIEVFSRINEKYVHEFKVTYDEKIEKMSKEFEKFEIYLKSIRNEAYKTEKILKNEFNTVIENIHKKLSELSSDILEKQEIQIYEWLQFTLIEPRYKKKISEYKKRLKSKSFSENNSKTQLNNEKLYEKAHDPRASASFNQNTLLKKANSLVSLNENIQSDYKRIFRSNSLKHIHNFGLFGQDLQFSSKKSLRFVSTSQPNVSTKVLASNKDNFQEAINSISKSHQIFNTLYSTTEKSIKSIKILKRSNQRMREFSPIKHISSESMESESPIFITNKEKPLKNQESLTNDNLIMIEDLQSQLETVKEQIKEFSQNVFTQNSKTQSDLNSLFSEFSELKSKNEASIQEIHSYLEETIKIWVLKTISSTFQTSLDSIKDIEIKVNKDLSEVINNNKELENLLKNSVSEFNSYVYSKRREISDISHQVKEHKSKLNDFAEKFFCIHDDIEKLEKKIKNSQEINKITYYLLKQEEIDKKSISLIGCKSQKDSKKKVKGKSVVSLDRNCISCINNVSQVIPAFKMACLAYNSSPISYNNKIIDRIELIENLGKIVDQKVLNEDSDHSHFRSLTPELPKIKIKLR